LVASADLASSGFEARQSSSFWMETISHGQVWNSSVLRNRC
jgi:hypothetical protein